jgi:ABC-type nitrate/sulfonate/bicarbonate transport system substrate-binding protein
MRRTEFLKTSALAAGALALSPSIASAVDATPIRFGNQTTLWGAGTMVAEDTGLWTKYGAKIQSTRVATGTVTRDGLVSGSLDAGTLGVTPFILAATHADLQAVAVNGYMGKTLAVVVGKDSKYRKVSDLKGARIGTNLGSTTNQDFIDKIAPANGLSDSDYHLINMSFQDMVSTLETKDIDAFLGVDPFPTLAVYKDIGRILTDYSKYDYAADFFVFRGPFVRDHRDDVIAFLRGYFEVLTFLRRQPAKFNQILYNDFEQHGAPLPLPVLKVAMTRMDLTPGFRPDMHAYMTDQAQQLMKRNAIGSIPDWNTILRPDILAAAQRSG